jgi:hypothetical protein
VRRGTEARQAVNNLSHSLLSYTRICRVPSGGAELQEKRQSFRDFKREKEGGQIRLWGVFLIRQFFYSYAPSAILAPVSTLGLTIYKVQW